MPGHNGSAFTAAIMEIFSSLEFENCSAEKFAVDGVRDRNKSLLGEVAKGAGRGAAVLC